jgi:glycosyltransferase involved in cell wall biosynthesis
MKILFAQNIVGIAGSENYFLQLFPELLKKGYTIGFLCFYPHCESSGYLSFKEKLENMGVDVFTLEFSTFPRVVFFKRIKEIIKENDYDIIHTHLIHADLFLAITKLLFNRKLKIVSTKHGYEEAFMMEHGLDHTKINKNFYYFSAYFAEKLINRSYAISKSLRSLYIKSRICNSTKLDLIYTGFDYPTISLSETKRYSNCQLVIAARLTKLKGHIFAFNALKILKLKFPDIVLLVIGTGKLQDELKRKAEELGIEKNVIFLGFQKNPREWMAVSDVVIFPSIAEGFGLVAIEAFSVKKPVVAFDVPAINEIVIHNETGLLAKPLDSQNLAENIESLLTDPNLRKLLTDKAFQSLTCFFNQRRMMEELEGFYKRVI